MLSLPEGLPGQKILAVPVLPQILRPFSKGSCPSFDEAFLRFSRISPLSFAFQYEAQVIKQDAPGDLIHGIVVDRKEQPLLTMIYKQSGLNNPSVLR